MLLLLTPVRWVEIAVGCNAPTRPDKSGREINSELNYYWSEFIPIHRHDQQ